MYRYIVFILFLSLSIKAQTKKPATKTPKQKVVADTLKPEIDTTDFKEAELNEKRQFAAYTRLKKRPKDKVKLCIHLVSEQAMTTICINDSICRNPEVAKILFEQKNGDSTYVLVLVDAFTKVEDKPSCDGGKETKLVFVRWNTNTNKVLWKQKNVSSCIRAITNMTKEPIEKWDKRTPLIISYHKGGTSFSEIKFDPQQYLLGMQSVSEN